MSRILGPDGFPIQSARAISDEDLIKILTVHGEKVNTLTLSTMRTGLLLEWVIHRVGNTVDTNGDPLVDLKLEEFPAWGNMRMEEIRAQAREEFKGKEEAPSAPATGAAIDLNDE